MFLRGKVPELGGSKGGEKRPMPGMPHESERGRGEMTKIIHHPGGIYEVHHADGEKTEHPSAGHMAAHLHAKHEGGEAGNMHMDGEGKVITHHAGMDGEVQGPHEHESPHEAASHMAAMFGGEDHEGMMPGEPDGDEGEGLY